jgi:hypothetical protein
MRNPARRPPNPSENENSEVKAVTTPIATGIHGLWINVPNNARADNTIKTRPNAATSAQHEPIAMSVFPVGIYASKHRPNAVAHSIEKASGDATAIHLIRGPTAIP